jgi:hypothetical protein
MSFGNFCGFVGEDNSQWQPNLFHAPTREQKLLTNDYR